MKKKLILMALALWSMVSVQAYGFEVDGISYWTNSDTSVSVESRTPKYSGSVVIPATVTWKGKTYTVTAIGSYAFYNCSGLTSMTIPNSVTRIESYAFQACSGLTSVTIPNSVTSIGSEAFYNCSGLTSVTIGEGVTSFGHYVFQDCENLTTVAWNAIDCQDQSESYWRPFYGCENITAITLGNKVKHIPAYLYYGMEGLTSVTIPESVTSIGKEAFIGCRGLTAVTLPAGLTSIGNSAFSDCSGLTSLTIPEGVDSIGSRAFYNCNGLTSVTLPEGLTSIGERVFSDCSGLTSVTIPEAVDSIGNSAFEGCSGLASVTLPTGLVSIGHRAFCYCSSLASVTLPAGLTFIGDEAFYGTSIATPLYNSRVFIYMPQSYNGAYTIPSGIQRIAGGAFSNCYDLASVTIPNSVTVIGDRAFFYCSYLTSVTIPESVDSVGGWAFSGTGIGSPLYNGKVFAYMPQSYSGAYAIPSGIQRIAGGAFDNCDDLTSVTIPNSVTMIGNEAFYDCDGLTSVSIPNSVTTIGERAFYSCSDLTSVTIGEGVSAIGTYAFEYSGLTSVTWNAVKCRDFDDRPFSSLVTSITFGDKVSYIPASLCYNCDGLASVTIPESVDSVGEGAFAGCDNLTSVVWNAVNCRSSHDDTYYWSNYSPFRYCYNITTMTFGDKVTHIPANLCYDMDGLTSVTIPESVTSIGKGAFIGCRGLTAVTLPAGLTSIGNSAFMWCSGLTSLTFPESVTTIGPSAFYGCSGLTSVTIPEGVDSIGNSAFGNCENLTSVVWNAIKCRDIGYRNEWDGWSGDGLFGWNSHLISITFGEKVTRIPGGLCYGCEGLTSVTLPASVTAIGDGAIDVGWKSNLIRVTSLAENPPVCEGWPFYYHKTLYVPRGSKEAYEDAPIWGYFNKIIELGNGAVVTLRVNDEDMGRVHGEGDYELGEQARLAAVPYWGYHFVRWEDGNTENPRMLTVTGDIELTAVFAKGNTINNDVPADVANENLAQAPVLVSAAQGAIQVGDAHGESVSVYNLQGIRIYHAARLTGSADIPVPTPGVYVVKVNDWTVKLMVR